MVSKQPALMAPDQTVRTRFSSFQSHSGCADRFVCLVPDVRRSEYLGTSHLNHCQGHHSADDLLQPLAPRPYHSSTGRITLNSLIDQSCNQSSYAFIVRGSSATTL